jgi:hypothetical protein
VKRNKLGRKYNEKEIILLLLGNHKIKNQEVTYCQDSNDSDNHLCYPVQTQKICSGEKESSLMFL